jgi:hypothetical protein
MPVTLHVQQRSFEQFTTKSAHAVQNATCRALAGTACPANHLCGCHSTALVSAVSASTLSKYLRGDCEKKAEERALPRRMAAAPDTQCT